MAIINMNVIYLREIVPVVKGLGLDGDRMGSMQSKRAGLRPAPTSPTCDLEGRKQGFGWVLTFASERASLRMTEVTGFLEF